MKGRPLIFGEVLFDQFPDGSRVMGVAPFNVAWHLRGLGADPLLLSRVGDDEAGREVLRAVADWGMDTSGVQVDADRPTGTVEVRIEKGEPRFEIMADQAYDRVDARAAVDAAVGNPAALLYHGTLALRSQSARETVASLLERTDASAFVDVNLRDPWWREEDLPSLVRRARWVKLNEAELEHLLRQGEDAGEPEGYLIRNLRHRFDLDLLVVTRGGQGAQAIDADDREVFVAPSGGVEVVDTVGAGDALASVVIYGLLSGWPVRDAIERAQLLASRICCIRGATTRDESIYRGVR